MQASVYVFLAALAYVRAQVPAHNVVSLGRTAIGYTPSRNMRNVNPYAKFDAGSMQNFRSYTDVRSFQKPAAFANRPDYFGAQSRSSPSSYNYPTNPTLTKQPSRFNYQTSQMRQSFTPSHGYTVNAPGFTKHKTFAGPAVHGTNQAFVHAG